MSKDFIQFITERYNTMTESEKLLSDYIITNFDEVLTLSIQHLSKKTGISVATIVRFAQHLGFEGFKEFRLYLAKFGSNHEDLVLDFQKTDDAINTQVSKMLESCVDCFNLTRQNIDYETLADIAKILKSANKIAFFGVGTSNIVCQDAAIKFSRVGLNAESACEPNSAANVLLNMKKSDVVFGVSHSGNNKIIKNLLKIAKKRGITTVAVTTFVNSAVCSDADHILFTQTRESPLHKIAITSRVSQFAMMDSLFMTYLSIYYDSCMQNIEEINDIIDSINGLNEKVKANKNTNK